MTGSRRSPGTKAGGGAWRGRGARPTTPTETTRLPTPVGRDHLAHLLDAAHRFEAQAEQVSGWGSRLAAVLDGGGRLLAAGNGGSAAQAQHLTGEIVGRYRDERRPYSAICLSAETSSLTAIGNDYDADELFARQVQAHGRRGDVFVGLSTSGSSSNVLEAARRATSLGLTVWAFTGPRPNPLADLADECLAVDAPYTATVQELHLVGLHMMCAAMDQALLQPAEATGRVHQLGRGVAL